MIMINKNLKRFSILAMLGCFALFAPAYAASDGCEDEKNDRITPELALCSVHAYNLGLSSNPTGADKQLMKEIVALKTTVITQQMNKQYEYMEAMIRRFKTQLEKAVLTTKLQAAGAAPSSSSDGSASGGAYGGSGGTGSSGARTNRGLANAEDCLNTSTSSSDAMQCLLRNVAKIQSAVTSGDLGTARRQLAQDIIALRSFNSMIYECAKDSSGNLVDPNCRTEPSCAGALAANGTCAKAKTTGSRRDDMTTCLGQFRACIIKNNEEIQRQNNRQMRQY